MTSLIVDRILPVIFTVFVTAVVGAISVGALCTAFIAIVSTYRWFVK